MEHRIGSANRPADHQRRELTLQFTLCRGASLEPGAARRAHDLVEYFSEHTDKVSGSALTIKREDCDSY
ncbi:hypothetical protein [Pelagibius sp.]|uniref:hypothetical protein n=1 Tax=Pelagibius sp. TaxID=1931238 RepID=UPI002636D144|nr:hypothetical protein [Pelagibius sp.]